jgi:hypothetical protein
LADGFCVAALGDPFAVPDLSVKRAGPGRECLLQARAARQAWTMAVVWPNGGVEIKTKKSQSAIANRDGDQKSFMF